MLIGIVLLMPLGDDYVAARDIAPGDTMHFTVAVPDTDAAVIASPDSIRVIFMARGAILDSTETYVDSLTEISNHNVFAGDWIVPAGLGNNTMITAYARWTGGGYTNNAGIGVKPAWFWVSGAQDWEVTESDYWTVIDSTDCTNCGVYDSNNTGVTNAGVWVTSSSIMTGTNTLGYGLSSLGDYHIAVPLDGTTPDTVYVWAWYDNAFVVEATTVIVEGDTWLGNSDNVSVIRKAHPQKNKEPESLTVGNGAILIQCDGDGQNPKPATGMYELSFSLWAYLLALQGNTRDSREHCGRIRAEFQAMMIEQADGVTTFLDTGYQTWVDEDEISSPDIEIGTQANSNLCWATITIPMSIYWTQVVG
jgi:hypothetical protein